MTERARTSGAVAERDFAQIVTDEEIERAARALEANGIRALVVETGADAKRALLDLLPEGAQVHSGSSRTLEDIGVLDEIQESGRFEAVRPRLRAMDRETQGDEIRRLGASPDIMLGSVHALTEQGELIIASGSGSQLGPYVSGAGKVIWVIGAQKIVRDLDEGLRRVREHVFPLEDARLRQTMGYGSRLAKLLILNAERPGRATAIIVKEPLGF
ncbi:MAG TPA: LUD domain-containing protein [Ktedonobacterales bacterium]